MHALTLLCEAENEFKMEQPTAPAAGTVQSANYDNDSQPAAEAVIAPFAAACRERRRAAAISTATT